MASKKKKNTKKNVNKNQQDNKIKEEIKVDVEKKDENIVKEETNKISNDEKKQETEVKQDNKKEENNKVTKITSKEFAEEAIKKRKKRLLIFSISITVIIVVLFFSIIFALLNVNRSTYMRGVFVEDTNLSGMNKQQATSVLEEKIEKKLNNKINITYKNETLITIDPKEIEFEYNLSDKLNEMYKIGRNSNIFVNNYEILFTAIFKREFELEFKYNEEILDNIVNGLDANIPELVMNPSYYIEDGNLIIVPGRDGIIIEKEKLINEIILKIKKGDENSKIEIPVADKKAEEIDVEKIHEEVYCEPKNAYYVEEPFELHLDEDGIDFAITIEEAKEIINQEAEKYTIPLNITKAEITISDIDSNAFRYQVSRFSTNYDPGYFSRVKNLQLAAGKIDGIVLKAGEEFSFNKVVGKRTIEAGYQDAKIFLNGEVVDGTGGGICQISTTLYNAVLLANLEITDRRNHNYTTSYVKAGRDATVVYGAIDFKFKNNREYPIKISSSVSGGVVTFTIYGIEQENEYDVKIIPIVTETIPKTTKYEDDPSLVEGSEVVKQVGTSGCKVTTYKEVYLNGSLVSKEVISNDIYKAMARIVKRGTMKASVPVVSNPVVETPPVAEQPTVEQQPVEVPVEDTQTQPEIQESDSEVSDTTI